MLFVTGFLFLLCLVMVLMFFHMDGSLDESFVSFLDTGNHDSHSKKDYSYIPIVAIGCTLVSIAIHDIFPSVIFLPLIPLLVFAFFLYKSHGNAKSVLFSKTDDGFKIAIYACFLFVLYNYANPWNEYKDAFIIILPFLLLYCCAILARHNLMESLFYHYRDRSIKHEGQIEKLEKELEFYKEKCKQIPGYTDD